MKYLAIILLILSNALIPLTPAFSSNAPEVETVEKPKPVTTEEDCS